VKVYNGSTELGAATVSGNSWSYSATVANGTTHQFNVKETDLAGNTSAATSNLAVTGDTTAPTAPSVSGTTPTDNTTPTWNWSPGGGGNGTYRYKLDNSDLTSGATETTSTSYTPGSGISEGSHTLYVQEQDAAGNWSSSGSRTIVIDTTAPSVDNFTLSDTALKAGDNATVTLVFSEAVASFSSSADITADNGTLAAMSSADNVTWTGTFTPTTNTEDASNTLFLATSYTDTAGNAGLVATTANYAVDTLVPSVSSISTTADNQSSVSITDNITVTFSEAMNTSYVTTSTSDTNCAGTIRVSSDNFSTCVRMSSSPASSNSNKTFTLDPYGYLTVSTTYLTRVTTGVKDTAGNAMSSEYETSSGFTTDNISTAKLTVSNSSLTSGTTYYWKVIASDPKSGRAESETWSFTIQ